MKSTRLKKSDIFKAANHLKTNHLIPSANKIREHLGSGSLSTITKYLKEWKQEEEEIEETPLKLPNILKKVDTGTIGEFMKSEHPQVIALALSYLDPEKAAAIMDQFDKDLKEDVLLRMAEMGVVQKNISQKIFKVIESEISTLFATQGEQKGGKEFVKRVKENLSA